MQPLNATEIVSAPFNGVFRKAALQTGNAAGLDGVLVRRGIHAVESTPWMSAQFPGNDVKEETLSVQSSHVA